MLVEFVSVVDAVRCAVDIQRGMLARNNEVPVDKRIEFRVGINVGDIISDEDDIFGDGVNLAARLEALAEAGGILVSRVVRDQVRDKLSIGFDDLGEQTVKNLAYPVGVHRIRIAESASVDSAVAQTTPPDQSTFDRPSIAVLPFENMSGDLEQEYFADGITEDIITGVSKLRWFFVIARNSSFVYRGKAVDVKRIARELGVRYVLEGSVRKAAAACALPHSSSTPRQGITFGLTTTMARIAGVALDRLLENFDCGFSFGLAHSPEQRVCLHDHVPSVEVLCRPAL